MTNKTRKEWQSFQSIDASEYDASSSGLNTNFMTLTRYVLQEQKKQTKATGELTQLLTSIQTAVKAVSSAVRRAGIIQIYGMAGSTNVQGEEVKKLDIISNQYFINMIRSSYTTSIMVSEENDEPIIFKSSGHYGICIDPLDGSSNIDNNGTIGSVFGIYRVEQNVNDSVLRKSILQPGNNLIAAGYALYGCATNMIIAIQNVPEVNIFTLDNALGEFILTDHNIQVPKKGKIYSINEGYTSRWAPGIVEYVQRKKDPKYGKPYSSRYVGSMCADIHRTLKHGGIFMYPASDDMPTGKLRLMYEANPMAFIMRKAGGAESTGQGSILDIKPEKIHQRTPVFLGSKEDIAELLPLLK